MAVVSVGVICLPGTLGWQLGKIVASITSRARLFMQIVLLTMCVVSLCMEVPTQNQRWGSTVSFQIWPMAPLDFSSSFFFFFFFLTQNW